MIHITATPPDQIDAIWERVRAFIASAFARVKDGRFSVDGVRQKVRDGRTALFLAFDDTDQQVIGVCGVEIQAYDNLNVAWCSFMAGTRMREWIARMAEAVEAYAKQAGCAVVEGSGRDGWGRAMMPMGYMPADTVVRKEL